MNTRSWNRKPFRVKEPTSVIHPQTISAEANSVDNVKGQFSQSNYVFKKTISNADQVILSDNLL